jgi:undecaprenyl-diphosphatase
VATDRRHHPCRSAGLAAENNCALFSSATAVLDFLSINGLLLLWGERLGQRRAHKSLDELSIAGAIKIGSGQALALLPGISRSGITLLSGLAHGLDHASAARFSFCWQPPSSWQQACWKSPNWPTPDMPNPGSATWLRCRCRPGAYASTWFLMRYFKKTEIESLRPLAGIASCLAWVDWLTAWTKL